MPGSFNNYARKVRDAQLPLSVRAGALRSSLLKYCGVAGEPSYVKLLVHLSRLIGADLQSNAQEKHLLAVLYKIEVARNHILRLQDNYARKRIRQKMRGKRSPTLADILATQEAIERVKREANLIPPFLHPS
ncbi:MAG: hypothetical protein H7Y38_01135 [Armatimonadetes bacterium]|nr:hypothetical protein [Armatimonadota bacterium]